MRSLRSSDARNGEERSECQHRYRCYRTDVEMGMLPELVTAQDEVKETPTQSNIEIHSRFNRDPLAFLGHADAITSMSFDLRENNLLSTSIDKRARIWSVDSGAMLRLLFTDSTPILAASYLPHNPDMCVIANESGCLHVLRVDDGQIVEVLQSASSQYF